MKSNDAGCCGSAETWSASQAYSPTKISAHVHSRGKQAYVQLVCIIYLFMNL